VGNFRRFLETGAACCAASWLSALGASAAIGAQNPDQDDPFTCC